MMARRYHPCGTTQRRHPSTLMQLIDYMMKRMRSHERALHSSLVPANKRDYHPSDSTSVIPRHPASVTGLYPGLLRLPLSSLFPHSYQSLEQLHMAVAASRQVVCDRDSTRRPADLRHLTDVRWTYVKGDVGDSAALAQWEATIPSPALTPRQLMILKDRAVSTCHASKARPGGHFRSAQQAAFQLATEALGYLRKTGADVPVDTYFIGAQITESPPGAIRGRHVDPSRIAAGLVTFSLEGTARVTFDAQECNLFSIDCKGQAAYMLTGPARNSPVHHRVAVTSDCSRLAVTLRFASAAEDSLQTSSEFRII